jgi:hypothetical protein
MEKFAGLPQPTLENATLTGRGKSQTESGLHTLSGQTTQKLTQTLLVNSCNNKPAQSSFGLGESIRL